MTLTGNIRKYWTLRKTGKQEPSRSLSTQKRMSIISMEYPSSCQIFGNQYYEKTKQRKQLPKLQHHQTESAKVSQSCVVPYRSEFKINQSGTTSDYFDPLQTHNTRHTLTQRILMLTLKQADVRLEYKARVRFALPYSWPNINWIVA